MFHRLSRPVQGDRQTSIAAQQARGISVSSDQFSEAEIAALKELQQLDSEIRHHDELYYADDAPTVSDEEYDALVRRAEALVEQYPALKDAYTRSKRVGAAPSAQFTSVQHAAKMQSLDNAFDSEDVERFVARIYKALHIQNSDSEVKEIVELVAEPKIDGLSLSLTYSDGTLVRAATRGDGLHGEDVTANVRALPSIIQQLPVDAPGLVEVRGEVYMSKADFSVLNLNRRQANLPLFANPRNAAAGSLRTLNPDTARERRLAFFAYSLLEYDSDGKQVLWPMGAQSQSEALKLLGKMQFDVARPYRVVKSTPELLSYHSEVFHARQNLDYEVDGVVYKVNLFDQQDTVGCGTRSPRWAIAHKFVAQRAMTRLLDISINVGRTGVLTPVAVLEPVNIGGVEVSRATLHNEREINRKRLHVGCDVVVERSGDVIPQVVGKFNPAPDREGTIEDEGDDPEWTEYKLPGSCPVCGSLTERDERLVAVRCTGGFVCEAQAAQQLLHFVSRAAFDIEGFGEQRLKDFYTAGRVRTPADIFTLKQRDAALDTEQQLCNQSGWGEKSAAKLFDAIERAREVPLNKLIYALGIRYVGEVTARVLADSFETFDSLWTYLRHCHAQASAGLTVDTTRITTLPGLGETAAQALMQFAGDERNRALVESLLAEIQVTPYATPTRRPETGSQSKTTNLIQGKRVTFTGRLVTMARSKAEEMCIMLGGLPMSDVTKKTDLVIVGQDAGAKLAKAQSLGLECWSEAQWRQFLQDEKQI